MEPVRNERRRGADFKGNLCKKIEALSTVEGLNLSAVVAVSCCLKMKYQAQSWSKKVRSHHVKQLRKGKHIFWNMTSGA